MQEKPLRVMQLALSLVIGGTEKLVYDIVHHVAPESVSSCVCCLDTFGHFGEELRREGYPVYALNREPGLDWKLIRRLSRLMQDEQIDAIHAHQYTPYFYGLMATLLTKLHTRRNRPKLIFTEHGRFYPDRRKFKRMLANPLFSLFTDEIVTISEQTKRSLITYENFSARRIKVIYNGIDGSCFSVAGDASKKKIELDIPPDAAVIGIVARVDSIKNHPMLFRAFKRVLQNRPQTYLVIVGDGPEEENLKTLAATLQIAEQTRFLGARRDVAELLRVFDVFALSSFSEGTSVTLLEAMGSALPIVATDVGGNPEVVQDQETGFLVPSNDDAAMAMRLVTLLGDRALRQRLGNAGRQRVLTKFSLDLMVKNYTNLYSGVCGYPIQPS